MPDFPLPLPTTFGKVGPQSWSLQNLTNCYLQPAEAGAKTPMIIRRSSGLTVAADSGKASAVRGAIEWFGDAYFVIGETLYRFTSTETLEAISGDAITGAGRVTMAANKTQIGIVDEGEKKAFVYTQSAGTIAEVTDADLGQVSSIAQLDSFAIYETWNSSEFAVSAVENFTNIDALDFASAERNPDRNIRVITDHAELWIMGERTIEVFQNVGGSFPFRRVPGGLIERGLAGRHAVAQDDNTVFWLGDDGTFYRANAYTPQRISTHPVEEAIEGLALSECEATSWTERGAKFVAWRFPTAKLTLVYDISTGLWHKRASDAQNDRLWRARCAVMAHGSVYFGGDDGKVYRLNADAYDEGGVTATGEMVFAPVYSSGRRVRHLMLELEPLVGRGLTTGQGSDPLIMMDYSDDGFTFGVERTARLGKIGEYKQRVRFHRLGSARERTYRLKVSDPIEWALMGATLKLSEATR